MIPYIYLIKEELKRPGFWARAVIVWLVLFTAARLIDAPREEVRRIPVALLDEDGSEISGLVFERIKSNDFIELKDFDDPMTALLRWQVDGFFVLKTGFEEKLLNGEKKGLIDFYYPPVQVTPEIIGEMVTREVMRVYISYKATDFIRGEYEKRGISFDKALEKETLDYTDSFWDIGDTISLNINYMATEDMEEIQIPALRKTIINAFLGAALLLSALSAGVPLIRQKENGVFTRLVLCNIHHIDYIFITVLLSALVSIPAAAFFFGEAGAAYSVYILWCALFASLIIHLIKTTYSFFLLLALIPFLMTALAGLCIYLGGGSSIFNLAGLFNPLYCIAVSYTKALPLHALIAAAAVLCARPLSTAQ